MLEIFHQQKYRHKFNMKDFIVLSNIVVHNVKEGFYK